MFCRRSHQTEKPHKCDRQFAMKKYLRQHQNIHTAEKAFKCDQCGKQFSQTGDLKRHIHTGEKAFKCEKCGKQFSQNSNLKQQKDKKSREKY